MKFFRIVPVLWLLFTCSTLLGQSALRGHIYEAGSDSALGGINVLNLATMITARSANDGAYSIAAREGDRVLFSAAGYETDTVNVDHGLLLTEKDISLSLDVVSLKGVTVTNNYQADSLARRNYYNKIYEKQPGITGRNRPEKGFGVVLSPISYFSKEARQKRQLRKRLEQEERDAYIDMSFPTAWVARTTGLSGDSLSLFLYRYRPSYDFSRKSDRQAMLVYVNDKLKEFRKPR